MSSQAKQPAQADGPAQSYLRLARKRIRAIRRDIPKLTQVGEQMAEPLLAGGGIWVPPVAPWWTSESSGRAGGLMGMGKFRHAEHGPRDVACFALPDPRRPEEPPELHRHRHRHRHRPFDAGDYLRKSRSSLFAIGREDEVGNLCPPERIKAFTGGISPDDGLYATDGFSPLVPLRPLEMLARGWCATGEMIAACTRAGKMPIIYMSVWLEGSMARNASMIKHDNLAEPWSAPLFHEHYYVPPLAPGHVAGEFLRLLEGILDRLEAQIDLLQEAGRWMAEAKQAGRKVFTVAVGHSYPQILELSETDNYPVTWGNSNSNLKTAIPRTMGTGDLAMHLGYAPPNIGAIQRILRRGLRFIYTTPYGRHPELPEHENLLWFDLPWRPGDASVDVPGYSVRILPMSSSAHTLAYFSVLCEFAEQMGWRR